jgi:hypothetical protein
MIPTQSGLLSGRRIIDNECAPHARTLGCPPCKRQEMRHLRGNRHGVFRDGTALSYSGSLLFSRGFDRWDDSFSDTFCKGSERESFERVSCGLLRGFVCDGCIVLGSRVGFEGWYAQEAPNMQLEALQGRGVGRGWGVDTLSGTSLFHRFPTRNYDDREALMNADAESTGAIKDCVCRQKDRIRSLGSFTPFDTAFGAVSPKEDTQTSETAKRPQTGVSPTFWGSLSL